MANNPLPIKVVIERISKWFKANKTPTTVIIGRKDNSESAENASIIKFKKLIMSTKIIMVKIHVIIIDVS